MAVVMGGLCEYFHNIVKSRVKSPYLDAHGAPGLDPSGAAEPDRHLIVVDDHRHGAAPVAEPEHALELRRVLLDVDVLERNVPPLIVVTGGLRVRSGVFAVNRDHGVHPFTNATRSSKARVFSGIGVARAAASSQVTLTVMPSAIGRPVDVLTIA